MEQTRARVCGSPTATTLPRDLVGTLLLTLPSRRPEHWLENLDFSPHGSLDITDTSTTTTCRRWHTLER